MAKIQVDSKAAFQSGLERRLEKQDRNAALLAFARQYFSQVPLAEVVQKDWAYAEATLMSGWNFYCRYDGKRPLIRVFNPKKEEHGFEHSQTIIEVACDNIPFLLDSIRIELNRQQIVLSDVEQCMMSVVRDADNRPILTEQEHPNETLVHLEVERVSNQRRLERDIREVVRNVQRVVDDFGPMRKKLLLWADEIGTAARDDIDNLEEAYEFLQWLYDNNYTFIGYEEFHQTGENGKYRLEPGSTLGLSRKGFYCSGFDFEPVDETVSVCKSPVRSRVHRAVYHDCVTITFGKAGGRRRACRFFGLFTSSVYNQNPAEIPIVRRKVDRIFELTGLSPTSHKGRELGRIIEVLPREELFLANFEELNEMVSRISSLQERRIVAVLARRDRNRHFVNCLVYVPKDVYDTELRVKVQELLKERFEALDVEFNTYFSESSLIRTHFILRVDPLSSCNVDIDEVERRVLELTRSWEEDLHQVLIREMGESRGNQVYQTVQDVFPPGYMDDYWPSTAFGDIQYLLSLTREAPLKVNLYEWQRNGGREIRCKLYHYGETLPLSDIIPILENLGARTIEERPYELKLGSRRIWIHDFVLEFNAPDGLAEIRENFEDAFQQIWRGGKENDGFNRLVTRANMNHRCVSMIRMYSRYLGQLQSSFSQTFIADCMTRYSEIAGKLFLLFEHRFNPELSKIASNNMVVADLRAEILEMIDAVENLSEDRILRRFVELIMATQRTNYYQLDGDGQPKDYISFKLLPELVSEMPLPKPKYEIFVYSPRVEGVHLRGGKIARGGLRWSDRTEDYRTEILGLVKAQQVKNSVIVPVGAKGGFLPKNIREDAGRDAVMEEGIACYRIFIQGLLDLTDNLVKGKVVPPERVVRYDEDDTYLVVAADKGTATFSDIANEISEANGFWLGDAFASGGSVGYDHKAMGITACGAWKSVQQHFRDLGVDIQSEDFTVVGIGDMAGDVFGNGMLLSEHICLVAAFNHQHIFIDPKPDAARSFKERQRLFDMPRSSWADYDTRLISTGGGVFSRSAKSITITPQMKKLLNISENALTPNQLINRILKAKVDLLWNGGIGTYVKSRHESHLDVGDKTNDQVRVNGSELRCRVIGEGGNLGLTQLARVEFNLLGGVCFTDFIDNAGGVNCSDEEVNIKILLNQLVEKKELTPESRRKLLMQMTDEIAEIVLDNNYRQAQAINLMYFQTGRRAFEYARVMQQLTDKAGLDPALEYLPSDEELQERRSSGQSFTQPELAVLTSYTKGWLKQELAQSKLLDEPYLTREMEIAFPPSLVRKYGQELRHHRLRREIVATQIANGMINSMGINFVSRMSESAGVDSPLVAKAYVGARDIFELEKHWDQIQLLDYKVDPSQQKVMVLDLIRLIRRTTRWLLRNRRQHMDLDKEVPVFRKARNTLFKSWGDILYGSALDEWLAAKERLVDNGVDDEELVSFVAAAHQMYSILGIVEASNRTGASLRKVADIYFALGEKLNLHWFSRQIREYQATTQWEALARESLQDDLNWQQVAITLGVISEGTRRGVAEHMIDQWTDKHAILVDRWMALQAEMRASNTRDLAVFTVGIRELLDLAQSSSGARAKF